MAPTIAQPGLVSSGAAGDRCRAASGARAVNGPALRVHLPSDDRVLDVVELLTPVLTTVLYRAGR